MHIIAMYALYYEGRRMVLFQVLPVPTILCEHSPSSTCTLFNCWFLWSYLDCHDLTLTVNPGKPMKSLAYYCA